MSASYIGSPISLTSIRGIRYRGILTKIDHVESTIGLSSVYSMGTENRAAPEEFIPPQERPYDYIVFRAAEVQNLALDVDPRPAPHAGFNDPAVLSTQAPPTVPPPPATQPAPTNQQPTTSAANVPPPTQTPAAQPLPSAPPAQVPPVPNNAPAVPPIQTANLTPAPPVAKPTATVAQTATTRSETPPVRSASASLETVERAINDLRISNASGSNADDGPGSNGDVPRRVVDHRRRGGRRAHPQNRAPSGAGNGEGGNQSQGAPALPREDFDFDRANSKFDKASIYAAAGGVSPSPAPLQVPEQVASPEPGEIVENAPSPSVTEDQRKFYDRSKSFFDDISSDAKAKVDGTSGGNGGRGGGGGRGRGARGGGRNRRDEERSKNMSTFGEAGTGSGHGYGQWQGAAAGANGAPSGGSGWRGGSGGRRRRPSGQPRRQPAQQAPTAV